MTGPQVDPSHYEWAEYTNRARWISYWHQIRLTLESGGRSALIVGAGDGLVATILEAKGVRAASLDIDGTRGPTMLGSVLQIPARDAGFDVVLACQVLEHLPFDDFPAALAEVRRVARRRFVVSLPQRGRAWQVRVKPPVMRERRIGGNLRPRTRHTFDGQHHWEVDPQHPVEVIRTLVQAGGRPVTVFQDPEDSYRRFFSADVDR